MPGPHLALCRRRRPLGGFTAVGSTAGRPQRDLGVVRLPARQRAHLPGVFGVLVGQLLLQEGLTRKDQLVTTAGTKDRWTKLGDKASLL